MKNNSKTAAAAFSALLPLLSGAQERPNILLIMTDQQRWDALGCMGNDVIHTPNLDALASEGTVFTSAYTSCPSSTPARAGLLTGLSPWHHGMLGYGRQAERYKYEMPRMLSESGYYTAGIGKMHWYPQRNLRGFDALLLDESGRKDDPYFIDDYRQWFSLNAPGADPNLTGLDRNGHAAREYALDERLHPTYWTGMVAREFLENYDNGGKPFFLKVSFARPHSPYDPPKRFVDMYRIEDIPSPYVGDWCGEYSEPVDPAAAKVSAAFGNFGDDYVRRTRLHYYAAVSFIDEQVGELIKVLKQKGMYDNTLILFVSDHGDMMGDHHHWRKTYPYEGSSHVPFFIKWPSGERRKKGSVSEPVELRDILPTFLETAGVEVPSDMDGRSVRALAEGRERHWRRFIDMEHTANYSKKNYWCGMTDGKVKYIWYFPTGEERLFDLVKDPGETRNVISDKNYSAALNEIRQALVEHLGERGEAFVKDGKLVRRTEKLLYSPCYPDVPPPVKK